MATTDLLDLTKRLQARLSFGGFHPPTSGALPCLPMVRWFLLKPHPRRGDFEVAARHNTTIPSSSSTAERKEAKAVLTMFLREQGFSYPVAARIVSKSDCFIDDLILKLHLSLKSRCLGREPATLEIRGALIPYLESLLEEYGHTLIDFIKNFPDPPGAVRAASTSLVNSAKSNSKKSSAKGQVSQVSSNGLHPELVLYLVDLGLDLVQINDMVQKFPPLIYCHLDRKIKPFVEFLLELGVKQSDIPSILIKSPSLCGRSISESLKRSMTYLENMGVEKSKRAKIITKFPSLLTYSSENVKATVDFLSEQGVAEKYKGKILTRCPQIIDCSIKDNLRPTADYFRSVGIDVAPLLQKCPQTFLQSIEAKLKPVTEFFLGKGFSNEELSIMVYGYAALYSHSIVDNLIPKWNYFLTMDYPKSDLVKFPTYFGYSLAGRIRPRYSLAREFGVKLSLNRVLAVSDRQFGVILEKKINDLQIKKQVITEAVKQS